MSQTDPIYPRLDVKYDNVEQIQAAYLPFFLSGGVFVSTSQGYELNQTVILNVDLPTIFAPIEVYTLVGWKVPRGASSWGPEGIGLSFTGHPGEALKRCIEGMMKEASAATD